MQFLKMFLVIPVALLLAAWSPKQINHQINETNVNVGDFCSGTIIDKKRNLIVTANHCANAVKKITHIKVYSPDGKVYVHMSVKYAPIKVTIVKTNMEGDIFATYTVEAIVVATDSDNDVAILQVTTKDVVFYEEAILSKTPVRRGDKVYAIGNPLMIGGSYSEGVVSKAKLGKTSLPSLVPQDAIVFTSYMNKGSSGGALYNEAGELIGITDWGMPGGPYLASPVKNLVKLLERLK